MKPELGSDAELQTAPNNGHAIESANQLRGDTKPTEETPIDYNQIAADTNQQEQYQTGIQ